MIYDPLAKNIPTYKASPPPGSIPVDWDGPSCIQLAGYNQDPPPDKVVAGQPSDPPHLWAGVCQTAVAATPGARIRWVTRTSGFHVVRPVLKLAEGSFVVGDSADGVHSSNSQLFLESELAIANVRCCRSTSRAWSPGTRSGCSPTWAKWTKWASPTCTRAVDTADRLPLERAIRFTKERDHIAQLTLEPPEDRSEEHL
jgi:hypothetical protein